jgi:hypothetical protein
MTLQRLDLTSLSLFTLVVRTGGISQGAALAHLAKAWVVDGGPCSHQMHARAAFGVNRP